MAQITWTAEAERWLEHIFEYITYLVTDDGNIDVLGVFHGALDISKYQL